MSLPSLTGRQKFWTALAGAFAQASVLGADGRITLPEGLAIAGGFVTAAFVHQITNQG